MVRPNAFASCLAACVWSGLAALLVGCGKSDSPASVPVQQKASQPPVKPPSAYIWEPNPTWLPQMTQTGDMGRYQVSLMSNFTPVEIKRKLPDTMKIYSWRGTGDEGQLFPVLTFTIWSDDKQMLAEAKKNLRKMLVNYTAGTTNSAGIMGAALGGLDTGSLGGIDFSRSKWSGQTKDRVQVDGITYGAIDGSNVIAIIAMSFGKDADNSNHLLESTIATLKRK